MINLKQLLKESDERPVNGGEEFVNSGVRKVFANAHENKTKYITYRQIESVGLGYIKDVSAAQKTAYECAVQMADKFGYFDDQDNERFALNQPDEVDEIRGASNAGSTSGGGMSKDAVMDYLKMMAGMPTHEQPPLKLWISLVEAAQLAMQRYVGQKGYSGLNEGDK